MGELRSLFAGACLSLIAHSAWADGQILERLDHFLAVSEKSEELFEVFSETLRLPIAWPYESYNEFASGGVSVGGSVLELISYADFRGDTHFSAIAFVPVNHIPLVRQQLEKNDVALGPNDPYTVSEDGETHVLWENFNLLGISSRKLRVFVCDYKYRQFVDDSRDVARDELKARNGGPLGVVGLAEVRVGTSNIAARHDEWSKLALQQESDDRFSASDGAQIALVEAPEDEILGITLKVKSLTQATDWLMDQGLLGNVTATSVEIAPDAIQGLSITLLQ